ncbi:hypothetical protein SERLADRAFT_481079 [Serpula lacrymans var. lacrymans S7.9]|uniref:Uncharacterized protein n=1 Tax=Serpula lacrymans var. lacrymans (strain S7.9) TaxID=578457 RepID=F8PEH5_SERL9|nr:uncharacterized protein SERLADRAFT_481079 [Serpula lacrymans var. lacrymans S7.9]EGO18507.1 hypothetical protein SERLADRAFT_481079 [Serpula lacrymans var. lacrymans S7.9]
MRIYDPLRRPQISLTRSRVILDFKLQAGCSESIRGVEAIYLSTSSVLQVEHENRSHSRDRRLYIIHTCPLRAT